MIGRVKMGERERQDRQTLTKAKKITGHSSRAEREVRRIIGPKISKKLRKRLKHKSGVEGRGREAGGHPVGPPSRYVL